MSDLFDRARQAVKLEDLAGKLVKLRGHGDELRGSCPLCGASPHSGSVFKVDRVKQTWRAFCCERFGDVVDLHAATTGMSLAEAARDLAGPAPAAGVAAVKDETPKTDDERRARILRMAADMISQARPIVGTLAERYLLDRAIDPEIVARLDAPTFHPAAPHSWNPDARVWRVAPAMILRIVTPSGGTGGCHVTYLDPAGGKSKTLSPAKRMWGPQGDETPFGRRRGGAWLIGGFPENGDLVIGEGAETALSLASWLWRGGLRDFGVCAALSLGGLQGGLQRDEAGAVDLSDPKPDPASPAFSWPPCYTPSSQLPPRALIAIDRDMSPQKIKGRTARGRLVDYELDAEARAKLCARLATATWRDAGWRARALMPKPNGDWNDTQRAAAQPPATVGSRA
jgi:hypothetical protein